MQSNVTSTPAQGAFADLAELISLRFPARQLRLARRSKALSVLVGPNKSNFRGRGIDFEEVRSYQAGDDIRTIDWRVTARTSQAHTKLFREERERPVLVVTDQRTGMFFGSTHCFKSVLAAHLSALLCWSALDNGDRVGGLVFNEREHRDIRPRRSRKNVLALLSELHRYNHLLPLENAGAEDSTLTDILAQLRRIARPGSSLFLVSDFHGLEDPEAKEHLFQLAQHTEITAIECSDSMEHELPRAGDYTVRHGDQRVSLFTGDPLLRQAYREQARRRGLALEREMRRLGIPLLNCHTGDVPFSLLQTYYGEGRR